MTFAPLIAAWFPSSPGLNQLLYSIVLAIPLAFLFQYYLGASTTTPANEDDEPYRQQKTPASSVMPAPHPESILSPPAHLNAPKFELYTQAELAKFDGSSGGAIYTSIKGTDLALTNGHLWLIIFAHQGLFSMSQRKRTSMAQEVRSSSVRFTRWSIEGNTYAGPYHVFAGKDASKALGMSSTRPEDAVPDWSGLSADQVTTLDGWHSFFQ